MPALLEAVHHPAGALEQRLAQSPGRRAPAHASALSWSELGVASRRAKQPSANQVNRSGGGPTRPRPAPAGGGGGVVHGADHAADRTRACDARVVQRRSRCRRARLTDASVVAVGGLEDRRAQ